MKKGCDFLFLLLGILGALAGGCHATKSGPACCAAPVHTETPSFGDQSLYQTEARWLTDNGREIQLRQLRGKPQVVVFFFASCQYACPRLVQDLRRIEDALQPAARSGVGFVLVTIDPARDTPESLAKFRELRSLPAGRWTLLHGQPDDILELAALLGVQYKQEANGQFAHSNLITVLNAEGEIVHQLAGLGQDVHPTVRELEKLVNH